MLFCIDGDKSLAKLKNTYNGGFTMFSQNRFDPKKGRLVEKTGMLTTPKRSILTSYFHLPKITI